MRLGSFLPSATLCLLVTVLASLPAWAVPEQDYARAMSEKVRPFYEAGVDGQFRGVGGIPIRYKKWENPLEAGALIVVPGRADAFATFAETIYDFAQKGYSIYTLDHRGQGASGRILKNPQPGYVDHFDDYVADFKTFMDTVVNAIPHERRFILAHSMGGAISTLYVAENPGSVNGLALAAPMLKINTGKFAMWEAKAIVWLELLAGQGSKYAIGQKDFQPDAKFQDNIVTHSEVRWTNLHEVLKEQNLGIGGATNRWLEESFRADHKIRRLARGFETPTLLLTVANDQLVINTAAEHFCSHAKHCSQAPTYLDASHDILSERDLVRDDAIARISDFFSNPKAVLDAR